MLGLVMSFLLLSLRRGDAPLVCAVADAFLPMRFGGASWVTRSWFALMPIRLW